jgi:uncharacterized RDD family membrane protein YckC
MPSWTSNLTARGSMAGPAGLALADIPERIIAWIIDAIIIGVIGFILASITTGILGDNFGGIFGNFRYPNLVSSVAAAALLLVVSGAYFIGLWSRMGGATLGQKILKLSVRDAASGAPIGQQQAINRWLVLGAPLAIWPLYQWGIIGLLLWLGVVGYQIYLLVTTAQAPNRQGFHDLYAKTVVAKTA